MGRVRRPLQQRERLGHSSSTPEEAQEAGRPPVKVIVLKHEPTGAAQQPNWRPVVPDPSDAGRCHNLRVKEGECRATAAARARAAIVRRRAATCLKDRNSAPHPRRRAPATRCAALLATVGPPKADLAPLGQLAAAACGCRGTVVSLKEGGLRLAASPHEEHVREMPAPRLEGPERPGSPEVVAPRPSPLQSISPSRLLNISLIAAEGKDRTVRKRTNQVGSNPRDALILALGFAFGSHATIGVLRRNIATSSGRVLVVVAVIVVVVTAQQKHAIDARRILHSSG